MAFVNTDCPIITLTTDFGPADNYTGIVKGIILSLNHRVRLIDISHKIPPFNILAGSYLLETSYTEFPAGTIHLAVIDPGVGTGRKPILIQTENYFFIGPDNGLFSFLKKRDIKSIHNLTAEKYLLGQVSMTFHGRDIFAPVAGYLSLGVAPDEFGRKMNDISRPAAIRHRKTKNGIVAGLLYIDHFGNLVTSIRRESLPSGGFSIFVNDKKVGILQKTFGTVKKGQPLAYINSFDYLEIAVNCGSAADYFSVDYDSEIRFLIAPE